jgi:NAD(P)-dependent dehydrogenase (short-subunit alcohol dehydrogenase family)
MGEQQSKPGLAVVTGAAGGMGSAVASQLSAEGWSLLLCDLDQKRLEENARPLRNKAAQVEILAGDIADCAFPSQLAAALGNRQIAALIHTAGLSPTMGDAARIFAVNYDATVRLVEVVYPRMAEGGCAVLISSSSAYMINSPEIDAALNALQTGEDSSSLMKFATKPEMAYPISKRAVIRLVAREATAFGKKHARIVSIAPGLIDTKMSRAEQAASSQMDAMLERTPLGRLGHADEIASVAVFLCSRAASYVTGCDIKVDGGMLAALGR